MKTLPARLAAACAARGIDLAWIGGPETESTDARTEMMAADIVFAIGRSALEAMVAARAVAVVGEVSGGDWVSAASYPHLEADGFTGLMTGRDEEDLDALLDGYDPALGTMARRLAVRHHGARQHATRLVELYGRVADVPVGAVSDPQTIARLAGERVALEQRTVGLEWVAAEAARELAVRGRSSAATRHVLDVRSADLASTQAAQRELAAELEKIRAQRDRARARRRKVTRRLAAVQAQAQSGNGLVDRLRRRRSR